MTEWKYRRTYKTLYTLSRVPIYRQLNYTLQVFDKESDKQVGLIDVWNDRVEIRASEEVFSRIKEEIGYGWAFRTPFRS